jgi:RNA polymerase sigma-70 factor (ECF subfamily)
MAAAIEVATIRARPPPNADADAQELQILMSRIARGCESALSTLYRRLAGSLHRVARRIVGSNECAQEVVADVFVFVWQNAASFDPARGTVRAWLHVATRHRAIDRRRSYRRHASVSDSSLDSLGSDATSFVDHSMWPFQDVTSVHLALSALSPLRRRLLSMAFFDDLTHEEIAARSGLPLGTVKSHVRRALLKMRFFLSSVDAPAGRC